MTYLESLSRELARVGITGRLRRRILLEFQDHLQSDPDAKLGEPAQLAAQFADELGTVRARRGAFSSFAALAAAGTLFAAAFVSYGTGGLGPPLGHAYSAVLGDLGLGLAVICAQVAFVSGVLAATRALRLRWVRVIPRAEATVIGRRAVVALIAGVGAMAGLALTALEFQRGVHSWWTTAALAAAAAGTCALVVVAPTAIGSLRVRPTADGEAGDIFADVGPLTPAALIGRPWAFAGVVAACLAIAIALAGAGQSDGYDGALRGLSDGLACLAGFALLGRYLGLRAAA